MPRNSIVRNGDWIPRADYQAANSPDRIAYFLLYTFFWFSGRLFWRLGRLGSRLRFFFLYLLLIFFAAACSAAIIRGLLCAFRARATSGSTLGGEEVFCVGLLFGDAFFGIFK